MASEQNNQNQRGKLKPKTGTYVSVSQLKLYYACPKAWYFKYVLGIPEPSQQYFEVGKAGHSAMEAYMKEQDPEKVIEQQADTSTRAIIRHALRALKEHEEKEGKIMASHVEYEFLTPIYNPFTGKPSIMPLYGFMDLIEQDETITDWKFLAATPETNPYQTDFQTIGYAAAFFSKFGHLPKRVRYAVFEKKTGSGKLTFFETTVDEWQIEEFWRELNRFAKVVKQEEYPKNISYGCKRCPFNSVCMPNRVRTRTYY